MLLIAVLIVLAVIGILAAQIDDWSRDFSTNHAATSAGANDPLLRSLELPASPAEVREVVLQFVEQNAAWTWNEDSPLETFNGGAPIDKTNDHDRAALSIPLVHSSKMLGFTDDLQVFLQPTEAGTLVDVVSQSRIGRGDLGQNPRNIRELLQSLRKHFAELDSD